MSKDMIEQLRKAIADAPALITSDATTDYGLYYADDDGRPNDLVLSGCTSPDTRDAIVFYIKALDLLPKAADLIERLRATADKLLAHCPDPECSTCGSIICPHGEPMHFHHDGCPACTQFEQNGRLY